MRHRPGEVHHHGHARSHTGAALQLERGTQCVRTVPHAAEPVPIGMQGRVETAAIIRHAIETGGLDELPRISALVHSTGALEATRAVAAKQAQRAADLLAALPDNPYRAALLEMAQAAVARRV